MDDSVDQLKSVESVANVLCIEFIGFHYTAAETNPCKLDQKLGEFQFQNLVENGQWLNDAEALKVLNKKRARILSCVAVSFCYHRHITAC